MDICGHIPTRERLTRIAALEVVPQSFLFSGPRRLGKFLVALEFAEKLSGTVFLDGVPHPDLLVIGRVDKGASDDSVKRPGFSVVEVRQAEEFLSRFPTRGKYRVVIIDEADRLTLSAENALLKMLEEPNSTSVIILVTHRPARLLSTVRSRLFAVSFGPVPSSELHRFFPNGNVPEFFLSLGLPGLIVEALRDPGEFEQKKEFLRGLFSLSRLSWSQRLALAEKLANDSKDLSDLLEIWLSGLARQRTGQLAQSVAFAGFLESGLETLDRVTEKEGNSRLLLEKLFTAV
ncbi:MAG: AAA family ATPase [Candidatus Moraniibacteriota bacterium]